MKVQRIRITYARGDQAREMSHLETMRALEQGMRSAGLPLAYAEGRRPTPQISIGLPLAVEATSDCELADVYLSERVAPADVLSALPAVLPAGLKALAVEEVGLAAPALQTQIRWAEYEVDVAGGQRSAAEVRRAISELLGARSLPWEHQRTAKLQRYDLRPLVVGLRLEAEGEGVHRLVMRLRVSQERSGRADQVVAALGLGAPLRVHRRRLYLEETPPAVQAYRRRSERED
jgi:radical SAM-linked protein